ncbi:MAG: hypothetical protein IPH57_03875 [Saprospiraceae bacterium]|nr:hypothetical protein [Saprospiraceae bacterium]
MGKRFFLFFLAFFQFSILFSQSWNVVSLDQIENKGIRDIIPEKYVIYNFDDEMMKTILWSSPKESEKDVANSDQIINVGLPDGKTEKFKVVEYYMMEPELALQYPDIRTFYGVSISDQLKSIRIDYTLQGFRAVISSLDEGKYYIDYFQRDDKQIRIVYSKKEFKKG